MFSNYTRVNVTYQDEKGERRTYGSEGWASIDEETAVVSYHGGVPIGRTVYGEIKGLPEPREGIKLIVSILVCQVNAKLPNPRTDLVYPDAGKSAIFVDGKLDAVRRFLAC